ncbi:hypothetical protein BY457_1074 [Marinilabilia salmonicolor]|uniref:hypothetical protein n=1 Tax=Marinilabilia salmonicolor TaxID=989 RepID=UPI000D052A3F|nr:hypothetical protein [Marinilabilia salmonicolor]PRY99934.1 hypothetical protein BY457_1074 [Marinilabilia salmonicolor]
MTRNLKVSLIISLLFVGLIRFRPIWERNPGGSWNILFFLGIAVLFFWLIVKIIIEFVRLIKQRKNMTFKIFISIIIMIILLFDGMFNPLKINLDKIYGQVDFRACYEGTQNQATLKLRENGKFDIHWTGVFFSDNFYTGDYIKSEDTLLLHFDTEIPRNLNDTLIVKGEYIYRIQADSLISTHFYLGHCKGLN